jgi:serine/threonine protein kinase/WD40 repeat protein
LSPVDLPHPPEKWAKLRDIYARLLEVPEDQQRSLVRDLCDGDGEIEREIEDLLSAHNKAGSFLNESVTRALSSIAPLIKVEELRSGTVLASRFHIIRHLHTGGMGAVYEAWDLELQEVLALKTIRPEIASEPSVIERFKEEVRQAHQITHPNVCRVYDLFSHDFAPGERIWFLTMQLLRGQTLMERLRQKGPLSIREALPLVRQMIAGLNEAHQHGIVHRDFKSSNVMLVQEEGQEVRAVIADFGLASRATTADSELDTFARQGTPAYVGPEQWFDGIASPAADQYSLGVVLCEILTGERPAAIKQDSGSRSPARLPAGKRLPPRWEAVIRRCLATRPEDRFASLEEILARIDPTRRGKLIARWVAIAMAASLALTFAYLIAISSNVSPSLVDLRQITPAMDFSVSPGLSASGKTITYVSDRAEPGKEDVWVQELPDGTPRRVSTVPALEQTPSISPDGRTVVFESSRIQQPGIYRTELDGAGEKLLIPGGHDPVFSPVDRSVLYWMGAGYWMLSGSKIFHYDLSTGQSTQVAQGMTNAAKPIWNSDGRHVLFLGCDDPKRPMSACRDWWITSVDGDPPRNTGVSELLKSQQLRPSVYLGGWQGDTVVFSALHGSYLGLWSIRIDPETGRVHGLPRQLFAGDRRDFILSSSLVGDSIAFCQMNPAIHIWKIENATHPEKAKAYKITQDPEFDMAPNVSPNGRWLVFARGYGDNRNIYLWDTLSGSERLMVTRGTAKIAPITNDSGTAVAYEASDGATTAVFLAGLDGIPHRLCNECRNPTGWGPDGESLLYANSAISEVRMMRTSGAEARTILSVPGGSVRDAVWSAKSNFVVFTVSTPDAPSQVFAARFLPGAAKPDDQWLEITNKSEFARKPVWSGDGKTIFYLSLRDGFWCIWGQRFDPKKGRLVGQPIPIFHYHGLKLSPTEIPVESFDLSTAGDSLYLNLAETGGTIWVGKLAHTSPFQIFR